MEQFEKWFSADGSLIPKPGDAGYEGYVERRAAWRAALKWALAQEIVKPLLGYYEHRYVESIMIRKEL